ncbi:hypothetical protein LV83_03554 [Algoriphagus yeomjeoni]|uniref:Uncharacterized protein n=2 Tax=Algoriphagus yeomjeoni TaxID=291403 RepID=A0A327P0J8_9BACT|nr:hypothetical protein LV83_03554 [Algoriphagus yeomjeoni]
MGLLASSCIEQEIEDVSELENSDIIAAKSWYEGFENQIQDHENARKLKNGKGKPDWSKSKVYHQSDGKKVIEVQFDFEEIAIPKHLKTAKLEKTSILQTLILFPKQDGSYVPYFLNIYPDSPDKKFKLKDFMEGGYQKILTDFSGVYRFYRWNGDFISGWRIKDGVKTHRIKDLKNQEKKGSGTSARTSNFQLYCYVVETTWFQYTCFEGIGCTTPEEIGTTTNGMECELVMAPPTPGDTGGGGGGGGDPTPTDEECEVPEGNLEGVTVDCEEEEEEGPGDRLCINSFGNISGGSDNSFWEGNLNGVKFENGQSINQFDFYFALSNGISDFAMNYEHSGTIINTAGSGSAIDYLLQFFPDIILSGDLYSRSENGGTYWYFTKYGAERILQFSANASALGVIQTVPQPHNPLNTNTKAYFVEYFDKFLKVFAPGSTTSNFPKRNVTNCSSIYSPNC